MLNSVEILLMVEAAAALRTGPATHKALAKRLDEALASASKTLATRQASGGKVGRPPVAYDVSLEPGWQATVHGIAAAADLVAKTLREIKGARHGPSQQVLATSVSRNGHWLRLLETADGTVALTVRRRKGAEKAGSA